MTVPKVLTLIHFFDKISPLLFDDFLGFCHQVEDSGFIRSFSYQLTTEGPKIPLRFVCRRRTHNLVDKTPTESCSNKLCIFSYVITLCYSINILLHLQFLPYFRLKVKSCIRFPTRRTGIYLSGCLWCIFTYYATVMKLMRFMILFDRLPQRIEL